MQDDRLLRVEDASGLFQDHEVDARGKRSALGVLLLPADLPRPRSALAPSQMRDAPPSRVIDAEHPSSGRGRQELNADLLAAVNSTGKTFLSHTKLNERFTLRLAIGNLKTREAHLESAWELLQRELDRLVKRG